MLPIRTATGYLVRLDPGEEVLTTLGAFLGREEVGTAALTGIGVVRSATLGYFDHQRGEYQRREISEEMELVSFTGNLTWVEGAPFVHAHAVLSGADFLAHGGHLFEATVAVTGEFWITTTSHSVQRKPDPGSGLKLISR